MTDEIEFGFTAENAPRFPAGTRAVYKPNHRSFGAFMLSERMRDATADVAKSVAELARSLAPRGEGDAAHMADMFEVDREAGTMKVGGNRRVAVRVKNDSEHAAVNEFGGKRNKRSRMLGRAGAAYGDYKPEGGPE